MSNHEDCGFVFVATGESLYVDLAVQAARTLKDHCPQYPVDLYTDIQTSSPLFDQIHHKEQRWFRSKIDSLLFSRFQRTVFLDADIHVTGDISDIFDLLDRFDIAVAHDQSRHRESAYWQKPFTASYPQYNTGVIGLKRSSDTTDFLTCWKQELAASGMKQDQPIFRELLWDSNLRIATLPPEYNLMHLQLIDIWNHHRATPKLIHSPLLHKRQRKTGKAQSLTSIMPSKRIQKLNKLMIEDGISPSLTFQLSSFWKRFRS